MLIMIKSISYLFLPNLYGRMSPTYVYPTHFDHDQPCLSFVYITYANHDQQCLLLVHIQLILIMINNNTI